MLIALVSHTDGPQVILTERAPFLRHHPSQVSLPGGRIEDADVGPLAAALREAHEEVGLPPAQVEILGCLPTYRTISDFQVHPFVGWVDEPIELVPQAEEVTEVFLVPLDVVTKEANYRLEEIQRHGRSHSYYVLDWPTQHIWGATAGILRSLAQALNA